MDTTSFGVVIMAAGKGTRLKSRRPKVLHEIGGRALLQHVIDAAKTIVPADQIYCVIGHEADSVRAAVEHTGVRFVLQAEQRGTGHALQMVKAEFALNGTEAARKPSRPLRRRPAHQARDHPRADASSTSPSAPR